MMRLRKGRQARKLGLGLGVWGLLACGVLITLGPKAGAAKLCSARIHDCRTSATTSNGGLNGFYGDFGSTILF